MSDDMPVWTRVKPVTAQASKDLGGDKVLAAVSTRITHSARFSEYSSFTYPNRVVPFDAAIDVDRQCLKLGKEPGHLKLIADELGFVAVRLPQVALCNTKLGRLTGQAMKETAEVFAHLGEALDDHVLTPDELAELEEHINDAQEKLEMLRLQARAEVQEGE